MNPANPPIPPMPITLRKRGYFSGSSDHWRDSPVARNQRDRWKTKLPPRVASSPPASHGRLQPQLSAAGPDKPPRPIPAPQLIPRDAPFVEGQRYRLSDETELDSRLDLYVADPSGPWIRYHGVLMAAPSLTSPLARNLSESVSTTLIIGNSVTRWERRDGRWTTWHLPDLCSCRGHCFCRQKRGESPKIEPPIATRSRLSRCRQRSRN